MKIQANQPETILLDLVELLLMHHTHNNKDCRVRLVKNEHGQHAVVLQLDGWYSTDPGKKMVKHWQDIVDDVVAEVERRRP